MVLVNVISPLISITVGLFTVPGALLIASCSSSGVVISPVPEEGLDNITWLFSNLKTKSGCWVLL